MSIPVTCVYVDTKCCSSARPTSTARRLSWLPETLALRCRSTADGNTNSRRRSTSSSRCPFEHFGRSSSAQNADVTQHFARQLDAQGFIEERETKQIYSIVDRRFLPDRGITRDLTWGVPVDRPRFEDKVFYVWF